MAKYLSIKLAGHTSVKAFPNEEKTEDKHPDYKGDGVGVWVNEESTADSEPARKKGA